MIISKKSYLEKQELSPQVKEMIEKLTNCSLDEFILAADSKSKELWNGLRIDLYHYIPLLNRMDELLEQHVKKYDLDKEYPKLLMVNSADEKLVCSVLNYTYSLLEHCSNKEIYNSASHVFELIFSCSMVVRVTALRLTCLLCERFAIVQNSKFSPPARVRNALLKLATSFPPLVAPMYSSPLRIDTHGHKKHKKEKDHSSSLVHISLLDCINVESQLPSKWKILDFKYYNVSPDTKKKRPTQALSQTAPSQESPSKKKSKQIFNTQTKRSKNESSNLASEEEGLHHFILNEDTIKKLSYQQIYDKAVNVIPKDNQFDFVLAVHIAKAFNNKSYESVQLRQSLVTMKCLSVAAASCCCFYSVMASSVFDEEPYLLSYMADLINPDNIVPFEPSYAALRAFVSISAKKNGGSDLMRALGGNVNHGLLFHILRSVLKAAKEDRTDMDHSYLNYFFNLIANLIDNKNLVAHLRTAGLMGILLEFLPLKNSFRMTRSGPLQLIDLFLKSLPDILDSFIASNGFTIMTDLLAYEVDFALDNLDYDGGAPKDVIVSHKISVRQVKTINSLLKLFFHLIIHHQGDRMRNLYDSPILKSLIKIIKNPTVFGYELLTDTINIMTGIINNEPTAYAILNEAGFINAFFDEFDGLLGRSAELLLTIPDAIGAISLNKEGLQRVKSEDLIGRFFGIFKQAALCKELLREENASPLGFMFDELARHHPELEPQVKKQLLLLLQNTPDLVKFAPLKFHQSPKGSLYRSKTEDICKFEENGSELDIWESSTQGDLLECALIFLGSLLENSSHWKQVASLIEMKDCLKYICIPNVTFDYVFSNALFSLTSIIKFVDHERPAFALEDLMTAISKSLADLKEFISFDNDEASFFDQYDKNSEEAALEGGKVFSKLGILNCLLYVFSDHYGSANKLTASSMQQLSAYFASEKGVVLLKELSKFYRRITLEEIIIHTRTPADACKEVSAVSNDFSPFQIRIGKPNEKSGDWEGSSAKFKNLSVMCFHFARCQSWLRYIFNSLCRISTDKRQDTRFGMVPKNAARVVVEFSDIMVEVLRNIWTDNLEIKTGYYLVIVNLMYSTLYMRSRSTEQVNTMMVICLLQNGGITTLRELALNYFKYLQSFSKEDIRKNDELDYIDIDPCCTTIKLLNQILSIYTSIATKTMIAPIPSQEKLYPDLFKNGYPYYRELSNSVLIQTSLASFGLLNELLNAEHLSILETKAENIPLNIIEKLIAISKNFYCSVSTSQSPTFDGRLYPLSYEQVSPSTGKLEYLKNLGVSEAKALDFLTFYRNSLDVLYSEDVDELYEQFESPDSANISDGDETSWEIVSTRANAQKYQGVEFNPVAPQYLHVCTLDDLNFLRGANESNFIEYWLQICQLFPKAVFRVSDLLSTVVSKSSYGETMDYSEILNSVFMSICSFGFGSGNESSFEKLASMLNLLALLLDEHCINSYSEVMDNILSMIGGEITKDAANTVWFPSALLVFEKVMTFSRIPMAPTVEPFEPKFTITPPFNFSPVYSVDQDILNGVFQSVLEVDHIEKIETGLAIAKILILFCDSDESGLLISKSKVIRPLIQSIREYPDTDSNLQALVITLVRRCMESREIIEAQFSKELDRLLHARKSQFSSTSKPKIRELAGLLKENSPMVMRSDQVFVDLITEMCILHQCTSPIKTLNICSLTPEQRKFLTGNDVIMKEAETESVRSSTGLMQILLSELMGVAKKDFVSSPEDETPDAQDKEKKKGDITDIYSKQVMFKNTECAYACFLLQTIAELLFSYRPAKTEFLTFSKKQNDSATKEKPRSTALNLLIHQFISSDPFNSTTSAEVKRRRLITLLASVCIVALVSSVPIKGINYDDPKIVDPDMSFVRKFTADILIKVIKEANTGAENAFNRYGKIVDILDLICKLLGEKFELSVSSAVDKTVTQFDSYFFARELLDKKLPSALTNILSDLDVNFPATEMISGGIMRCLSSLGSIKVSKQELFREHGSGEVEEEDLDEEELYEREETPDLLRNSTLGMYDLEDVENEEDEDVEDDFLDEEDIEIVYSEDEDNDDPEGDEEDEDEMMDSDIEVFEEEVADDDDDNRDDDSDDSNDDGSVDELLDRGQFVIDIVSGSDEDMSDSELDQEDEYGDYPEQEFELIEEEDDFDNEDEDDEDLNNSDDDSAILEEWITEHENSERHRRGSLARQSNIRATRNDFFTDGDLSNEEEEDDIFQRFHSNPFETGGSDTPELQILSSNSIIPQSESLRESGDRSGSVFFHHWIFPRQGSGRAQLLPVHGGRLTDILRALNGHSSTQSSKKHQQVPNIYIKSTVQRWTETVALFYGKNATKYACRVIPSIVNRIFDKSMKIAAEEKRKEEEKQEKIRKAAEEKEAKRREEEELAAKARAEQQQEDDVVHDPIYVTIAGREVDISETDIDPEYLQALPEDLREEVFAQHVRERRAEATTSGDQIPEIDPAFMAALPDELRNEIMRDEYRASFESRIMRSLGDRDDEFEDDDDDDEVEGADDEEEDAKESKDKKRQKIFFSPMVDKAGVSALMKMIYLPQLYYKRESFFRTLGYFCYNKQTRSEIVSMLLYVLQEGINDQISLEASYQQLCQRSQLQADHLGSPAKSAHTTGTASSSKSSSFPTGCTILTVATQAIDVIQYLLENENHMRFHFLMDQESNPLLKKLAKKHKMKDNSYRYPINILLNLLDNNLIKEDTNLMDILSRTFQIATRPLQAIRAKLNELDDPDKKQSKIPQLPVIPDRNLKQIINILVADECASKVFQQTIASIQNLSLIENAKVVFPRELSKKATHLSQKISEDLRSLINEMQSTDESDDIPILASFANASSDQAKLLRVLTALDYLFQSKQNGAQEFSEVDELKQLYKNSALGPLWGALSDCLCILRDTPRLAHIATILSPLIEALMVVCKHSKVEDLPVRDVLKYQEKVYDFANEPIESLFFSFTEEHKKILNQMIRNNPKLMSGPFSVLIRNPKVLEFDNKRIYFDHQLHNEDEERPTLPVNVKRDQVFLDSYRALFFKSPQDIRKSKLDIQFRGEQGVDAGGLTREWYQVLSRQMFNPDYALFTPVASDKTTFHPNRTSWVNPEHLSFFKFVGLIIGKAVYDGCMLDCHFSRAVYKRILGRPVSLKDIESLDLDYYKSLVWMLGNDITDIIVETFSVETNDYGEEKVIDLRPNGRDIQVTEENKQEYVKSIVEYRLKTSVQEQMENFLQGFYEIIPKDLIAIFDDQELELLISGLPDIDVDDWKNNTIYQNYSASSPQIQWFWRAVKSFDAEEKAKLLQFSTGTSKVPLNGFKELAGMSGVSKFSIHRVYGSTDRLPSSHTCFNQIDLPEYESYDKLRGSLLLAIMEGHEGFGFA
ncbi:hypothetical protein OGAPHI_005937 [Ogataea philodendri]|uniref:HECT-type E3 ubiquitin transferase n=1 Tax=Ogataea philodendri TaxID=1378263 RepID=A0A9P8T125_9ASCO|nr:uncharacterized protein OGAPHI_005937 [Ogataea philodendri]KAH3661759.1 hypothetical protein OGAPHI_005937 [Ogataea philodendri]